MEAARAAFFARGFHAATIEDIAQAAGVSKVTVYSRFGDKETLFEEVVRAESGRMGAVFHDGLLDGRSLEDRLNAYGEALLGFLFSEDHLAVDRVLMHEIAQIPKLAQRFYEAGPEQCLGLLAKALEAAAEDGRIEIDDPWLAAEDICALWEGSLHFGLKLGVLPLPSPAQVRERVERGTRLFLKMVGSKP